ncbi:MAG: phosphoribosylamine--glycine ligase [Luteibaculaceae bacterium]
MNVLLLGSGGREHALALKLAESSILNKLFIAPGNAGTAQVGINVDLKPTAFKAIKDFCLEHSVKMIVVGPEEPLVKGIVDYFDKQKDLTDILVVGPSEAAAALEGSKDFAKKFMQKFGIPTAGYKTFTPNTIKDAKQFLDTLTPPYVLKADGLAAGKGVLILSDKLEAEKAIDDILANGKFGEAGAKLVIEEFLDGIELSVFVLTDGENYKILPEAKDYKRIGEGDTGLNTGGMGAVSPVPFADKIFMEKVEQQIVVPTVRGIKSEGLNYKGFVFIGLMNVNGSPYVIEYNVRMGDPETEVVIPRLKSDLLALFESLFNNTLSEQDIEFDLKTAVTTMLVSGGYPEDYQKGKEITGINQCKDVMVYHAGTTIKDNKLVTAGGRVLACTALGKDLETALEKSMRAANTIQFSKKYFRTDIGKDLL